MREETLTEKFESIDAMVFSGNSIYTTEDIKTFKHFLNRWNIEAERIEKLVEEFEEAEKYYNKLRTRQ